MPLHSAPPVGPHSCIWAGQFCTPVSAYCPSMMHVASTCAAQGVAIVNSQAVGLRQARSW